MNKLQNIVTGTVSTSALLLTSASLFGQETTTQIKDILVPTQLKTETSISSNSATGTDIPFHRTEIGNDAWTFKYDINWKVKPTDCPVNVGMLAFNDGYRKKDVTFGADVFQVGKFNDKDTWFADAWASKKFGDVSVMGLYGLGFPVSGGIENYDIIKVKSPKLTVEAALYTLGKILKNGAERRNHALIAYHTDHMYIAIGKKKNIGYEGLDNKIDLTFGAIGVTGFKDFGQLIFGTYDRKTGNIWLKSQTGFGDVNKGFYNVNTFDMAAEYFSMPAYFSLHFSPLSTKAKLAAKTEFKYNAAQKSYTLEAMAGTNTTPVQIGLGLIAEHKSNSVKIAPAIELYKDVKIGKHITASAEYRGNFLKGANNKPIGSTGYLKATYRF